MQFIENINDFKEIFKIQTQAFPNFTFDTYINNQLWSFEVRTFETNRSTITIWKNELLVCENAPFLVNLNLGFFTLKDEAIFFLANQKAEKYTWENLGLDLDLYYGNF